MGLCVGHDTLFYKHSHAPTTTLVTKDHITGNNACAGLYASKTVYRRRLNETIQACRDQALPRQVHAEALVGHGCAEDEGQTL